MRNKTEEFESKKVPTFIKYVLVLSIAALSLSGCYTYYSNNSTIIVNKNATTTHSIVEKKATFDDDVEKQIETSKKFVKELKANHERTAKAEELRARAEQAYKEATEQYNQLVQEENALIDSVKVTNPVALSLYYSAGMSQSIFATSTTSN